jgi:hypothetical protein
MVTQRGAKEQRGDKEEAKDPSFQDAKTVSY